MELAADLWDSVVDQQSAVELSDAQRTELVRRLRKAERDPTAGVSWEDLDSELARG
jgi:putative addiction module component (TIGR02574 family)